MVGKLYARGLTVLAAGGLGIGLFTSATAAAGAAGHTARAGQVDHAAPCALGPSDSIRHVIYLQFDNVHLSRDNPNVPSDLQQMPNLLNFITAPGARPSAPAAPSLTCCRPSQAATTGTARYTATRRSNR
jgi:hypothetical protein